MVNIFMPFFRLVRWKNLLLAAFIQLFLRYGFVIPFGMIPALSHAQFALGVLATMLVMAGGYIVNDIFDLEADKINKPDKIIINRFFSEKTSWNLYYLFTGVSLLISLYLSLLINRINYFSIPVITAFLLYLYATDFKRRVLIGNFIISLLAAMSIITVLFFDIMPVISSQKFSVALRYFVLVVHIFIALFAFVTTLIRELIKTLEDVKGDQLAGFSTVAVHIGERKTLQLVRLMMLLLFVMTLYAAFKVHSFFLYVYVIFLLLFPWFYVLYLLNKPSSASYAKAHKWMKLTMFTGVFSLLFLQL